jgi:putative DNA primase/helicase
LSEYHRPAAREVVGDRPAGEVGDRPGDHFNGRVPWSDVLAPHGWKVYRSTDTTTYWCRPGKSPAGISASTGFCKGECGGDLLYVFSTSAAPFEAERSYSKFAAYALLSHHGDYAAAGRALRHAGYGGTLPRKGAPR